MVLVVVVASLRCVRAQRRRAHSGLLVPLGKLVSTLLALRELALLEMNCTYGKTAAHALLPRAALWQALYSSLLLQHQSLLQGLAAATSKAEPRPFEPSLRVDWCRDASDWETRAASSPQSSTSLDSRRATRVVCSLKDGSAR